MNMKKTAISAAVGLVVSAAAVPQMASAAVLNMDWDGYFTMLDTTGNVIANTSITTRGANQALTPITGTMSFDTVTNAGTATLVPFDFFGNNGLGPTAAAEATGIEMQAIGDGMGGEGTLVLGNMLFNWGGSSGIPVSIVLDAAGFFGNASSLFTSLGAPIIDATISGTGATPDVNGTYVNATFPSINIGPSPIATLDWNVHIAPGCGTAKNSTTPALGGCMGVNPSGGLPLVADTALNTNKSYGGPNVYGIAGAPMWDGPFVNNSANFNVSKLTLKSVDPNGSIGPFEVGPYPSNAVPVPAAVWLFGSGLVGLVGVARRRNKAV